MFKHRLERYNTLPCHNDGEIPDDFDLLKTETALPAFIRAALEMDSDTIDINGAYVIYVFIYDCYF